MRESKLDSGFSPTRNDGQAATLRALLRRFQVGPDAPQIDAAVTRVDAMIGRLLDGLETRGILNTTHVIMVGDHGMTSVCECKDIYLEDLAPWVDLPLDWVNTES